MESGALVQLYGTDTFLFGNTSDPYCYNNRDSMMYWFIEYDDGLPSKKDLLKISNAPHILDHVPDFLKHMSIKEERAIIKIQRAWRNAIENPCYKLCKNRLLKEFYELNLEV